MVQTCCLTRPRPPRLCTRIVQGARIEREESNFFAEQFKASGLVVDLSELGNDRVVIRRTQERVQKLAKQTELLRKTCR